MKKIKKAFLFYFSLIAISVLIQSCCTSTYRIIGNGTIEARVEDSFTQIDTITGPFSLVIFYELEQVASIENFSLISSTMATSCEEKIANTILPNEVTISCAQEFMFDGNMIAADTDLSNLAGLDIQTYDFGQSSLYANFGQDFIDKATFQNQDYTFKITSKTDDGLDLENEVTVMISL